MSKTKDYISEMMDKGVDVLAENEYDPSYEDYLHDQYLQSLVQMNEAFAETEVKTEK